MGILLEAKRESTSVDSMLTSGAPKLEGLKTNLNDFYKTTPNNNERRTLHTAMCAVTSFFHLVKPFLQSLTPALPTPSLPLNFNNKNLYFMVETPREGTNVF